MPDYPAYAGGRGSRRAVGVEQGRRLIGRFALPDHRPPIAPAGSLRVQELDSWTRQVLFSLHTVDTAHSRLTLGPVLDRRVQIADVPDGDRPIPGVLDGHFVSVGGIGDLIARPT